jgi:hypothetical protein
LAGALLAGCATTSGGGTTSDGDPSWIETRRHPEYPERAYLVGVGTAQSGDRDLAWRQARDRAVADIAGQLETHIRSEVTTLVRESLRIENGDAHAESVADMSTGVQAISEATLAAIQQVAQHYDPTRRSGAVMVVIKRSDYAVRARDEIEALDARVGAIAGEAERLAADGRLFQATRRYGEVEQLTLERAAAAARANFVQPGTAARSGPLSLGEVFARQQAASAQVRLVFSCRHQVFGQPGPVGRIEQAFVDEFGRMGIAVRPAAVPAEQVAALWQDPGFLRTAVGGGGEGQALLLFVEAATVERPAGERDLISVLCSGTARLVDARSGDLLRTTVYSPDAARASPQIGRPAQRARLVDLALEQLAGRLFEGILEEF